MTGDDLLKRIRDICQAHPGSCEDCPFSKEGMQDFCDEARYDAYQETFYLFEFSDCSTYEMTCAVSFKDAVWEMSKYTGDSSELLFKCLNGFEEDDVGGIVDIYNRFSAYDIVRVYHVKNVVYNKKEKRE